MCSQRGACTTLMLPGGWGMGVSTCTQWWWNISVRFVCISGTTGLTRFTTVKLCKCPLAATSSKVHCLISHLRKAPVMSSKVQTALHTGQRHGLNANIAFATSELHHQATDFVLNLSWERQKTCTHSLTWSVFCWPASWCLPSNPQAQPSFLPGEEREIRGSAFEHRC